MTSVRRACSPPNSVADRDSRRDHNKPTGFAVVGMGGGKTHIYCNRPKYFSELSSDYSFGYSITLQPNNSLSYTYDVVLDSGISAEKNFAFHAADLKHIDVKYQLDASVKRAFPVIWTSYISSATSLAVTFYDSNADPMIFPFTQESYYTQRSNAFPIFHQREAYTY